jgi:4-amino-4-deoxy-L-arabinose transferase-like glycosyltransferase
MSVSWKAFFYGAFDPKATITIDKLAGAFVPQALSARIFGFHAWSLVLPQVIEGVISVLAMYRMVRRWAGVIPGLVAALVFALTPIGASMFGHSMEDGALTMCLVLAAGAWTTSVAEGRLAPLLWAGFWIGAGFQCKMLQAWMVLPAFFLAYLFCARGSWGRRIRDLVLFGVVTLGVSLSWILLYTLTPASARPYIDGSMNNSVWAMVFGYNGLEHFGYSVPGEVPAATAVNAAGWTKLLGSEFGPQIGWLFPLTVAALACGLLWTRKTGRSNPERAGFVFWGIWFVTFFLIFSKMGIPHTAYVASLAPAIAALSAAGIVMFWRQYRAGSRRGWMLPISVAASAAWAIFLWRSYSGFLPWALWTAVAVGLIAIAILLFAWVSAQVRTRLVTAGLTLGVVAMLAPTGTWAASVLDVKYDGYSANAQAGPDGVASSAVTSGKPADRTASGSGGPGKASSGSGVIIAGDDGTSLTSSEQQIYNYVSAHRGSASYLMAVGNWTEAAPYILATGQEVMPMGGYTTIVPEPTLAEVKELVHSGQLKFFLLDGFDGMGGPSGLASTAIDSWVGKTCTEVPAKDYGGTTSSSSSASSTVIIGAGGSSVSSGSDTLYECKS